MAKHDYQFKHLYFKHGTKRLIHEIIINDNIAVLFTHFSLNASTRQKQLNQIQEYIHKRDDDVILLADFNIFQGFVELDEFIKNSGLVLMNDEGNATFTFHNRKLALDLCLCSPKIAENASLTIINQPFSDHDALVLEF